ncbi:hypothetical protein Poli38472_007831 [Pythium oligandrum]|uniref:Nucleotide-diphospho-sugar transferase domain-containing protein n=1 Tax=Pythium oligandrum TaxID=41045 RepID=A0A8K1FP98_PYTOL|nr:hypothetical protein Poli38472_007831 [Pythium oligandrum]|eukprot:TMW68159.1 hypothetical protein Poli38472_007831 [Pythium oligandrum]
MRNRLRTMLLPLTTRHGATGPTAVTRRTQWTVLLSLVALAVMSMAMLSSVTSLTSLSTLRHPAPTPTPTLAAREEALKKREQRRRWTTYQAEQLSRISQRATQPRGIVMPLFDKIAFLGFSLILELRAMHVDLPIEIPHCGDLDPHLQRKLQENDAQVRIYDVCQEALTYSVRDNDERKLFCRNMNECRRRFRGFDIKIVALLLSRFDEVMMLDADALFFASPMRLWESPKYIETGTLFFHDRVSCDHEFLAARRRPNGANMTHLQEYLTYFDVEPFQKFATVPRPKATSTPARHFSLPFSPSEFLVTSHSWNDRAGHQADSSVMLWNKKRQQRATAILASFIALNGIGRPPSYGDKEFYFISCELAESNYAFSDYGVGAIGLDARDKDKDGQAVLCGDALHYLPDDMDVADPPLFYMNSDHITSWTAKDKLYRTVARPASLYPGKVEERGLAQECPFDVTLRRIEPEQAVLLTRRHKFHDTVVSWNATRP